jgi:hypothetical protein
MAGDERIRIVEETLPLRIEPIENVQNLLISQGKRFEEEEVKNKNTNKNNDNNNSNNNNNNNNNNNIAYEDEGCPPI